MLLFDPELTARNCLLDSLSAKFKSGETFSLSITKTKLGGSSAASTIASDILNFALEVRTSRKTGSRQKRKAEKK